MDTKEYIENFIPGREIFETLYVEEKTKKISSGGKVYLDLLLRDKTGSISSKVWEPDNGEIDPNFIQGDFVLVQGMVETFKDKLQLRVRSIEKLQREEVNLEDFISSVDPGSLDKYLKKIHEITGKVQNPFIKQLLDLFLNDDGFMEHFKKCPAAKEIHHNLIGGLVKHIASMLVIGHFLSVHYKYLNFDLLVAGIVLHDIGKIRELETDVLINYTPEGEMVGHTVLGLEMVRKKISMIPDFPGNLATLIEHMILSHHGTPEFGAIRTPRFREAMMLHLIDTMDARMDVMSKFINKISDEELWSERCYAIDNQKLMKIDRFLTSGGEK